jgi:O-succinylhomoserine sulfhydrylase
VAPLYQSSAFAFEDTESAAAYFNLQEYGNIYSRIMNPTVAAFEERVANLEGGVGAVAFASGMAAQVGAFFTMLAPGDHIVASRSIYGGTITQLKITFAKLSLDVTLVDPDDMDAWRAALRPETKALFAETIGNPGGNILDIAAVAEIAHAAGATLIVDNVFATPIYQSPLALGADCVVYSATKHIDGQGRCLGGVILGSEAFIAEHIHNFMRQTGPSMSPFNAWVLLKGLETLAVRVRAQTETAGKLADYLAGHAKISRLLYPGRADHPQADLVKKQMRAGSTLIGFEVKGGKQAAFRCLNALKLSRISNNLGDAKSLVTHPATTTHQRLTPEARSELGISEGFIRFSAGLEHADDLIEDFEQALEKA